MASARASQSNRPIHVHQLAAVAADAALLDSGLLGPVRVFVAERITIEGALVPWGSNSVSIIKSNSREDDAGLRDHGHLARISHTHRRE